jgi:signal transduction histidine kinase
MYKTYGLEVDFTQHGSVNMIKDETQLMLTQMVRELLDNVIKYSGVLKAGLIVNCENRSIKIIVSDAGKGFTPDSYHIKTGEESQLGLFSIKERLKLFGGKLEIESKINHGTRCTIHLPYSNC